MWTSDEIAHKLDMIRRLPEGELRGWWRFVHGWREPFPGEIAALHQRAQRLGVTLSSPVAPSASTTAAAPQPLATSVSTKS